MRKGWLSLCLVLAIAACGAPEISDLENPGTGTNTPPPTGSGTGTPTPGGSPTPTGSPTPPLPSMNTYLTKILPWENAQNCTTCHSGGTGGFAIDENAPANAQGFNACTHICNTKVTSYTPPAGVLLATFCSNETTGGLVHMGRTASNQNCTDIGAWMREGMATAPFSCAQCINYTGL